jgi:8-oxo-dGTP diphosphatase
MNPFEQGVRKVIPAVLIYARWRDRVLMMHRIMKDRDDQTKEDYHAGKWNGLGGKCELDESPLMTARREFQEESGIELPEGRFQSLGVVQFPNFKPHQAEDWMVFIFTVEIEQKDLYPKLERVGSDGLRVSSEGVLHWIPSNEVLSLNLWPGDRNFIPYVLNDQPFMGTIWYQQFGSSFEVSRVWIQSL